MQILFEDNYLLAIDKPAGLSTESGKAAHPSAEKRTQAFMQQRQAAAGKPARLYLRVVHRLDRAASGLLVLAKTKTALTTVMRQFEEKQTEKVYLTETSRPPHPPDARLEHFLMRTPDKRSALVLDRQVAGSQPAQLRYHTLKSVGNGALLEIFPETGRFHQIRAQLAHIGCPIVGDVRYGGPVWREHAIKLHAWRLTILHPKTGERLELEAPPPADW
ncbi:MAG: RluA family pseudouridine synthase [Bacteroidetes bacterium]|nr:MAG: RluA family pseudouridine synthase [Bacteroidota bacterium]